MMTGPEAGDRPAEAGDRPAEASAPDESSLVTRLRAGDESAFLELVERFQRPLVRAALLYVPSRDVAQEVVQETWIAVLNGIDRFEGRSSLRTWIFRIATYQARTRGERERRTVPLSRLLDPGSETGGPSVDPERFQGAGSPWPGHWVEPPASWGGDVEARLLGRETGRVVADALETLPPSQRLVITLRDVQGWSSEEVCDALEISAVNQRVLLHRARSRVRAALERYLADAAAV
jgi:RNA polymerase sigma-70 factor (ECF subfamily)